MRNFVIILTVFLLSIIYSEKQSTVTLEINKFQDIQYISAIDYATDSNMKQVFIENKEKLIIQYESKKIIFSPNSSYVIINEKTYPISPIGKAAQELIIAGGLESWVKERI